MENGMEKEKNLMPMVIKYMKENIKMENGMDMENYIIAFLKINFYIKEILKMEKNMEKE